MVKLNVTPLSDAEVELIQSTLEILSDNDNRREIIGSLLSECPSLEQAFSMVMGIDRQAAFLMNMMCRGFNYVCYQSFDTIYDIFVRHPKYDISLNHFATAYKFVIQCISSKCSDKNNCTEIVESWKKVCAILESIADSAYNRPDEKQLNKFRKRVMRSMTMEDISTVQKTWSTVNENEIGVADILANLLQNEKKIILKFQEFNIDVFKQSVVLIKMVGKAIDQLQDTDMIVPWLKKLGRKHVEMNVGPRLLATMKPVMISTLSKSMGFAFTDEISASWNRVLSFIIGIMVEVARVGNGESTQMTRISGGAGGDDDCLEDIENQITPEVIKITQTTWRLIDNVLDKAVNAFYQDLISSKAEIRNLFNKSNMVSQTQKLLRAIGSCVALLDNPDTLVPILEELGRRHVYYNVQPKYFKYLKKAWFKMLKRALALKWNSNVENAWNVAWKYIVYIMKSSLEDALLLYIPPDPEKIKLKVLINHIDSIHVQKLSFYGDIWYAAYTGNNPSQSSAFNISLLDRSKREEISSFYDSLNKPLELAPFGGIKILNAMDTEEQYRKNGEKYLRKFSSSSTSDINDEWYMRGNVRGTFAQKYNLLPFPFDHHKLTFLFALEVDDTIAEFDENSLFVRLMPFKINSMAGTEWDIYPPQIKLIKQSAMSGGSSSGKRYTHSQIEIPISRKYTHHIYETILPLLLIECVAFAVYFAEEFPMVERLTVVVTLLLTLFAFKWTVAKSLPPTSYLTLMDYFFMSAYALFFLHITGLSIITLFDGEQDEDEHAEEDDHKHTVHTINWAIGASTFIIFLIIHIILFIKSKKYIKQYPKRITINAIETVKRSNILNSPTMKNKKPPSTTNQQQQKTKLNKNKAGSNKYKIQPISNHHEI